MPTSLITKYFNYTKNTAAGDTTNRTSQEIKYVYKYDESGYLIQLILINSILSEATNGKSYFGNNQGPYRNIWTVTTEITDYNYESGKLKGAVTKNTSSQRGDNDPPIETIILRKKTYQYNTSNLISNIYEISTEGWNSFTLFNLGIRNNTIKTFDNGTTVTTSYDSDGKSSFVKNSRDGETTYSYDQKGNVKSSKIVLNDGRIISSTYVYDDSNNPQILVSSSFKGIPEPIRTIQSGSFNNEVNLKYINGTLPQLSREENTSYTYNAKGFPETATSNIETKNDGQYQLFTTFRYREF